MQQAAEHIMGFFETWAQLWGPKRTCEHTAKGWCGAACKRCLHALRVVVNLCLPAHAFQDS